MFRHFYGVQALLMDIMCIRNPSTYARGTIQFCTPTTTNRCLMSTASSQAHFADASSEIARLDSAMLPFPSGPARRWAPVYAEPFGRCAVHRHTTPDTCCGLSRLPSPRRRVSRSNSIQHAAVLDYTQIGKWSLPSALFQRTWTGLERRPPRPSPLFGSGSRSPFAQKPSIEP